MLQRRNRLRGRTVTAAMAITAIACWAPSAMAGPCRVTDFTERTLNSLNEVERLSFAAQMSPTEYTRLKSVPAGDPNRFEIITGTKSLIEAQAAARARLESLNLENIDEYQKVWATDFLTDDQVQRYSDCISNRLPGLTAVGRSERPGEFHITLTHLTAIGIEKVTTRLVASNNIANIAEFEAFLASIGARDNYSAQTFALKISDPAKPAVLVMRAGWETPKFLYIPTYPTPDYFK